MEEKSQVYTLAYIGIKFLNPGIKLKPAYLAVILHQKNNNIKFINMTFSR